MPETSPSTTLRAFVALDPDVKSVRRIARLSEHLRRASGAPSASWTAAAQWHVTLKFMGKLPASAVGPLGDALSAMFAGKLAPSASLRLGAFPSLDAADVVVAELDDPDRAIAELGREVEKAARSLGLPRATRALRPHVTLARLKRPFDARKWLRPDLAEKVGECQLASLTLYESHLRSTGSIYEALSRTPFLLPQELPPRSL